MAREYIDGDDSKGLSELLVGRSITYVDSDEGIMSLDDGTALRIRANDGCGGCSSGNYRLDSLKPFENVITRVEVKSGDTEDGYEVLSLHVYAEGIAVGVDVITVLGYMGYGGYGRGYSINVIRAEAAA